MAWYHWGAILAGMTAVAACGDAFTSASDPAGTQGGGASTGDGGSGARANGGNGGEGNSTGGEMGGNPNGGDPTGGNGGNGVSCKTCQEAMGVPGVEEEAVCMGTERFKFNQLRACLCDPGQQCADPCHNFCLGTDVPSGECYD